MSKNILPTVVFAGSMIAGGLGGYAAGTLVGEALSSDGAEPTHETDTLSQQAHDAGRRVIELANENSDCESIVLSTIIQGNPKNFPTEPETLATLFGNVCVYGEVEVQQRIANEAIPKFAEAKQVRLDLETPQPSVKGEMLSAGILSMLFTFGGTIGGACVGDRLANIVSKSRSQNQDNRIAN